MLAEPTFWLYTAGNVNLNKMLADFHINIKSKCWKFEEFTSLRVESCFFLFICERQSMSPGDGFEILTLRDILLVVVGFSAPVLPLTHFGL